jgi:predicted O-methyltransferase YrrM
MLAQTIDALAQAEIERFEQVVRRRDDARFIPRQSAEFLHTLVLVGGFRRAVEIGTSFGYSGTWLATALRHNGGTLVTIDRDENKTGPARAAFERAGLAHIVRVVLGPAEQVLPGLEGPFDFAFIDADKPGALRQFELLWPKLAQRATIVTDNVASHERELHEFTSHLRQHPQLRSTLIPIGSGLELTVKVEPGGHAPSVDGADWVI